jgi:ABC-type dipeptide/oligopeptide/nickel transport system permease component
VFQFVVRRILLAIPVLLFLTLLLFLAIKLVPGDAALVMAGERATPEKVEYIRNALNLNSPWYVQYFLYLKNLVLHFNLGDSLFHEAPVLELLKRAVPATIELGMFALLIAVPVGILLGMLCAVWKSGWVDKVFSVFSMAGVSIPIFWLALILMYVFSVTLGWVPSSGRISDEIVFDTELYGITGMYTFDGFLYALRTNPFDAENWNVFLSALLHLCMPAIALSTIPMSQISRVTRASFLDVLGQDYVRTARAKGVAPWRVVCVHVFRNSSLQVVTISLLQAGALMGGAVITETMFSWPGLGKILVESIGSRDFPMVQSGTLFVGVMFVLFNLLADLMFFVLDPRVQNSSSAGDK